MRRKVGPSLILFLIILPTLILILFLASCTNTIDKESEVAQKIIPEIDKGETTGAEQNKKTVGLQTMIVHGTNNGWNISEGSTILKGEILFRKKTRIILHYPTLILMKTEENKTSKRYIGMNNIKIDLPT